MSSTKNEDENNKTKSERRVFIILIILKNETNYFATVLQMALKKKGRVEFGEGEGIIIFYNYPIIKLLHFFKINNL